MSNLLETEGIKANEISMATSRRVEQPQNGGLLRDAACGRSHDITQQGGALYDKAVRHFTAGGCRATRRRDTTLQGAVDRQGAAASQHFTAGGCRAAAGGATRCSNGDGLTWQSFLTWPEASWTDTDDLISFSRAFRFKYPRKNALLASRLTNYNWTSNTDLTYPFLDLSWHLHATVTIFPLS